MKPVLPLFIFIDACGWEIVKDDPFLKSIAPLRKRLRSVFGYSSACVPSILSGAWPDQHRNEQILLVRIDPHVRDNVAHDRLPSSAALAPSALTRDFGGSVHHVECTEHYNVTMESRSFHTVCNDGNRRLIGPYKAIGACFGRKHAHGGRWVGVCAGVSSHLRRQTARVWQDRHDREMLLRPARRVANRLDDRSDSR